VNRGPENGEGEGRPLSEESKEGAQPHLAAPFEIVAMDDESHSRLRIALESLLNQTTVGLRFSNAARFSSIASGLQIFGENVWSAAGLQEG
jgi:hypothetical protein